MAEAPARPSPRRRAQNLAAGARLAVCALGLLAVCAVFLTAGARDPVRVLPFRLPKLGALLCVGWTGGVSTVMFQTVTGNRILTPSVLGLDSLYALIQALMLIGLGAAGAQAPPGPAVFAITVALMVAVGAGLMPLVLRGRRSATTLVLLGIVLGALLRSLTTFIQRLLDPNTYLVLQSRWLDRKSVV